MTLKEQVIEKLKKIYDPEIPVDIYNLGLIYTIDFEECAKGYYCNILMSFTSPNCPVADMLLSSIKNSVSAVDGIYKVEIKVTFSPPWGPERISQEGKEVFAMENIEVS